MKKVIYVVIAVILSVSIYSCYMLYKLGGSIIIAGIKDEVEKKVSLQIAEGIKGIINGNSDEKKSGLDKSNTEDITDENGSSSNKIDGATGKATTKVAPKTGDNKSGNTAQVKKELDKKISDKEKDLIVQKELDEIKSRVTMSDKLAASALVLKRLSPTDINYLNELMKGGITKEKKEKAKKLVYSKFTPEEIEKLKVLYHKYMN